MTCPTSCAATRLKQAIAMIAAASPVRFTPAGTPPGFRRAVASGPTATPPPGGRANGGLGNPDARPILELSRAVAGPDSSKGLEISPWDAVAGPRKRLRHNAGVFFCAIQP